MLGIVNMEVCLKDLRRERSPARTGLKSRVQAAESKKAMREL